MPASTETPAIGQETFVAYANRWYEVKDLAASTMQTYRHHIEEHLLPTFQSVAVDYWRQIMMIWPGEF